MLVYTEQKALTLKLSADKLANKNSVLYKLLQALETVHNFKTRSSF